MEIKEKMKRLLDLYDVKMSDDEVEELIKTTFKEDSAKELSNDDIVMKLRRGEFKDDCTN